MSEPTVNEQVQLKMAEAALGLNDVLVNATSQRNALLNKLLDPRRNLNKECGYPETQELTPDMYRTLYDRESIATRVVQVEAKETWQVTPEVYEDEDSEENTPFEEAWDSLSRQLVTESWYQDEESSPVWEHLQRVDILSGIGHFGVLLMGFDDGAELQFPAPNCPPDGNVKDVTGQDFDIKGDLNAQPIDTAYGSPIASGLGTDAQYFNSYNPGQTPRHREGEAIKLIFLRAFDESLVQIVQYEASIINPRFGKPIMYLITLNDPREQHSGVGLPLATVRVHWSRVIHVADNLGSSEIFGVPRMRPVYNRLLDLAKLYGGSAEMYWRAAFPGLSIETHPQLGGDVIIDQTAMRDMMDNYWNKLDRGLQLTGMTAKSLAPQVSDPTPHIDAQITAICIEKAVPKRILMGSEQGVLAADQDSETWNKKRIPGRRKKYVTPKIIVPLVDRLIMVGVLPEPGEGLKTEEEVTKGSVANRGLVTHGGPGSGPRPGGGHKIDSKRLASALGGSSFEKFQLSKDKAKFVEDHLNEVAQSVGLETKVQILKDADFNNAIAPDAKVMGIHPGQVSAAYKAKENVARFRARKVEDIKDANGLRLFLSDGHHELGHAYDHHILGHTQKGAKSELDYHNSRSEDFANTFSSRMGMLRSKHTGKTGLPKSVEHVDAGDFVHGSSSLVYNSNYVSNALESTAGQSNEILDEDEETPEPDGKLTTEKDGKKKPGYHVKWPEPDAQSPDQLAKNALARTQAMAAYQQGGVESLMDPMDYLTMELGLSDEEAKQVIDNVMKHLEDSYPDTEGEIMPGHVPSPPAPELPPNSPIKMGQGETLFDPNEGKVMHATKPAPKVPVKNEETDGQKAVRVMENMRKKVEELVSDKWDETNDSVLDMDGLILPGPLLPVDEELAFLSDFADVEKIVTTTEEFKL